MRTTHLRSVALSALLLISASTATAQLGGGVSDADAGKLDPPTATFRNEESSETGSIFVCVLLVALGAGVNLIPTKRGHQD